MGGDCEGPDMQSVVFGGSGGTKQKTGARYEGRMRIARHLATGPWWEVWKKAQKKHVNTPVRVFTHALPTADQQRQNDVKKHVNTPVRVFAHALPTADQQRQK